ncbi:MAG: hypothetical protein J0H66_01500 [Solirubrobacterales bacterium]|nr:hypothetical protein [Solirubrobacterales bacterium]OJU95461.1 MAG: hypothetical protein BGO23_06380 [Solirubrobacterales bacterium 67-14]
MEPFASVVNTTDLFETVAAAFVASLAIALVSSLGIWGGTKYVDYSQEGRGVTALLALGVGVFGLLATVGIIGLGIALMVTK